MEKNIYDILNEIEIDIDDYEKAELNDIEKQSIKNSFRKNFNKKAKYKKVISIAAFIVIACVMVFGTNLGAYAYESANLVVYKIASFLGLKNNLDDYSTVVNKSVTKSGITVQLNEVVLDNNQLLVLTTITSKEKIENVYIGMNNIVYINGKRINHGASGSSKHIDEHTVVTVMTHILNTKDLSGDLNVKIVFSEAYINGDTLKGPWVFGFKTNGDELVKHTVEIRSNNTFILENGQNIILEKYTSNALGQKIYYSKDSNNNLYDMVLRGHDDLGNNIEFYLSNEKDGSGIFEIDTTNRNLDNNAKELYLTPYAAKLPEENGRMNSAFKKCGQEVKIILTK